MGTLADDLLSFLSTHSLPGVSLEVQPYVPLPLSVSVQIRVQSAFYDPGKAALAVQDALKSAYALEHSTLGAPLFRSQLLHLIEGVEGVENASANILTAAWAGISPAPLINDAGSTVVRSVKPHPNQMIHYDADLSRLIVAPQEFTL